MKPALKLTPSRVRDYLVCPRKFEQQYMAPVESKSTTSTKRTENAAMSLGTSLHSVLDALHKPDQSAQLKNIELSEQTVDELLARHWHNDGFADKQKENDALEEARSILRYYCRSPHVPQGEVLATEAYLSCISSIKGHIVELACRVDRMELHSDGTLEIIDYKVSANGEVPGASILAEDLPTFLYFLLAWHYYRADPRVHNVCFSMLNLMTLTKVSVKYNQRQLVLHREALGAVVQAVMRGSLEPQVNAGCAWCPVREDCPSWAELDMGDLDSFEAWSLRK